MAVRMRQSARMGWYLMRQRLAKRDKFPLIVELEPLFQCNLACSGCGKIQHPEHELRRRMPVEQAIGAIAVDMESVWLAAGAGERPCGVVRVVLDSPSHELLRPRAAAGAIRAARVLRRVARSLHEWAPAG